MVFGVLLELVVLNALGFADVLLTGEAFTRSQAGGFNFVELNPVVSWLPGDGFVAFLVFKSILMLLLTFLLLYTHVVYSFRQRKDWVWYLLGKPKIAVHLLVLVYFFVVVNNALSVFYDIHLLSFLT